MTNWGSFTYYVISRGGGGVSKCLRLISMGGGGGGGGGKNCQNIEYVICERLLGKLSVHYVLSTKLSVGNILF